MNNKNYTLTPTWGDITISKNKSFEYQFEFGNFCNSLFEFKVEWTTKCDHAGPSFTFSIYKLFWINFKIYDHRHWDSDLNVWKIYSLNR